MPFSYLGRPISTKLASIFFWMCFLVCNHDPGPMGFESTWLH